MTLHFVVAGFDFALQPTLDRNRVLALVQQLCLAQFGLACTAS